MRNYLLQDYVINSAIQYPEKIAIKYKDKEVSYKELMHNILCIADTLKKQDVEECSPVGIYLEKSDLTIASMQAVLIRKNNYVMLDSTTSPVKRIMNIVMHSELEFLVSNLRQLEKIAKDDKCDKSYLKNVTVICIEKGGEKYQELFKQIVTVDYTKEVTLESQERRAVSIDTAYILYTSGSTGIPKGVVLSHLNARTFVDWCVGYFKPNQEERFISEAPFHFDLSVFDIYVPLAVGATLVIVDEIVQRNPLHLIKYLQAEKINYLYSVPSLWIAFVKYGKIQENVFPDLKSVLFAGEVFPAKYLKEAMKLVPHAGFYNLYGLIETNVFTYYKVESPESVGDVPVPIGIACENSEAVIIKDGEEVTVPDVEGELCARGPIIMKGYYKNEALTKQSFIESPCKRHDRALLYKTGDIAKYNDKMEIIFSGRKGTMVKRNGFRIELPEIEVALYSISKIEEAAVVSVENKDGMPFICVGLIPIEGQKISVVGIKNQLVKKIPTYMIPDYFVVFDNFQRSINGKIDRQYLKEYFLKMIHSEV